MFFRYTDRPGVVGIVGTLLGEAGRQHRRRCRCARRTAGGDALMMLTVDTAVPPPLLAEIADAIGATAASTVDRRPDGR